MLTMLGHSCRPSWM